MKLKLLTLFVGAGMLSATAFAETIPGHVSINVLDKDTLTIEDVTIIKNREPNGIEELIQLGDFYSYNETFKDSFQSFSYYNTAARQGSEYAKMMVGYMTYKGYGTTKNTFKGVYLLENVKKPYDKNASYLLALNYLDDGHSEKAITIFKTIKDPQSYRYLTKELISERRYEEAIPYLEWLIQEESDTVSKRELGSIFLKPSYNKEEQAVLLLKDAANDGDAKAQYKLGYYFHKGTADTKANIKEAVRWYTISSQNGDLFAKQELLKIWNYNNANNNVYKIDNDPYLIKLVQEDYSKETEKRLFVN